MAASDSYINIKIRCSQEQTGTSDLLYYNRNMESLLVYRDETIAFELHVMSKRSSAIASYRREINATAQEFADKRSVVSSTRRVEATTAYLAIE